MTVVTNTQHNRIANLIRAGKDWRNGTESFSGFTVPRNMIHQYGGWMTAQNQDTMRADAATVGIDYVIRSYQTPIAYRLKDGSWIVPIAHYSTTSQRHQSHVWSILRAMGIDTSFEWVPDISEKTGKPLKSRSHRERTNFAA